MVNPSAGSDFAAQLRRLEEKVQEGRAEIRAARAQARVARTRALVAIGASLCEGFTPEAEEAAWFAWASPAAHQAARLVNALARESGNAEALLSALRSLCKQPASAQGAASE